MSLKRFYFWQQYAYGSAVAGSQTYGYSQPQQQQQQQQSQPQQSQPQQYEQVPPSIVCGSILLHVFLCVMLRFPTDSILSSRQANPHGE